MEKSNTRSSGSIALTRIHRLTSFLILPVRSSRFVRPLLDIVSRALSRTVRLAQPQTEMLVLAAPRATVWLPFRSKMDAMANKRECEGSVRARLRLLVCGSLIERSREAPVLGRCE